MIIYEKDNLGRSIIEIVIKNAGSIYAKEGVAYFLTHIFNTKGSRHKKEKFYSVADENAIEFHASVNREFFTFSLKFLNSKKKKALSLLKEILTDPNFSEESFEKSKKEIYAKIQNKQNDNDYIASNNLFKAIFKNTPLSYPVTGENIDDITLKDVKTFYEALFHNEIVVINGGEKIELNDIMNLFKQKHTEEKFFRPQKTKDVYHYKNVEQSYIHFASPFDVDYGSELHLAKISSFILGSGGFGSRMMEEIRVKRGYAYSAYVSNAFRKTYKLLSGYLQTKLDNQTDAINLVKELIDEFYENGINEEELIQAKKFLIGSEPLRNETLTQRLLKRFNEIYLNLPENYYDTEPDLIKNVSIQEVNEFIKKHPEIKNLTFSVVTKK
jgi:predicted Zn-dependent peptidase